MKKIALLLFLGVSVLSFEVSAQNSSDTSKTNMPTQVTTTPVLDVLLAQVYVGKYKVKEGPFEELIVSIQNGKLFGEAVGQGSAVLEPTKEAEIFDVIGYDGTIEFVKNDLKVVIKAKLTIQGNVIEAEKQP